MAKHIGDLAIGVAFLSFVITGFITFLIAADQSIGVNTDVTASLQNLNTTDSQFKSYESSFFNQVDNTTTFEVQENVLLDKRGTAEAGLTKDENENTITSFLNVAQTQITSHPAITGLLIALVTIMGGVLLLRSILGENRI